MKYAIGLFAALALFAQAGVASANLLTNGSLTGPIVNSNVPPGWVVVSETPDTIDQDNNAGFFGVPFVAPPSGPSPDGGTWVGFGRSDALGLIESFGQTVTLVNGHSYQLSWYVGNFGVDFGSLVFGDPNSIEVFLDGVSVGTGGTIAAGPNWTQESISFVATGTSQQLSFQLASAGESYLSIDGINLVPQPTTLALLGLGLAALGLRRRLRA